MPRFPRVLSDLPRSSDRWRDTLEAVLKVNDLASSAAALEDSVHAILNVAVELLGAQQGSIMLLEDDRHTLSLVAAHGLPLGVPLGHRQTVGESISGRVLATGKPLLLGDVDREAFVNFVPQSRPISSSVVVPLRVQGRAIGVLNLATTRSSTSFTSEDMRVAQLFADQAGGVIHRARLHERAERRSSDLMALVESSKGLLGTLDLDSLLRHVLDGGARLAGAQDGFVCLFDQETGAIDRGVFRGMDKGGIRTLVADEKIQKAIQATTVATLETAPDATLTAVGLRTSRGTKGLLAVAADPRHAAERADLLMAFGQQCASAIGAAELYSVVERKESELASIIQAVPNPIVLVDARGRIVAMNPAAEDLFGTSATFSIGAPVAGALGHPEVEATLSDQGAFTAEVEAGSPARTYKLRVADVRVPGAPVGRVLIMDDVTAEREIAQTQRDFVAMIGHELRTPLTLIKGFARTLIRRIGSASTEETIEALSTIDTKAGHLERLIEDLLYVSNVESREAVLKCEEIDLGEVMARVSDDVIQQFPTRQIVLEGPRSLIWPADETKVALVLRHLLNNALKYSEDPGPVTLRVSQEDDEVQFDVVDKGAGLLSSDLPTIFERFRQIDSSSTREHGGTGVGLYLCAQLVRMHGGRIWVDSTWGKGSIFSFALPHSAPTRRVVQLPGATRRSA